MTERTDKYILKNGMVILGEPMEGVESVAFCFMIPAGASKMPENHCGAANIISDWIFRGAGSKNSRELGDALDGLGLVRSSSVSSSHITIGAALESGNLIKSLRLYSDILINPHLKDDQFDLARQLVIDDVLSLDDDPRRKVMLKLRELFYPSPMGRSTVGEVKDLENLAMDTTRNIIKNTFTSSGIILSVAGKYDFENICQDMEDIFSYNKSSSKKNDMLLQENREKYLHINNEGAQVHIGLMTGTVIPTDDNYYNARVAVSVLSGGMSARLFTEVREKRGLCYAIGARYHGLKQAAGVMCYAGTTPEKAQETYEVIIEEFKNLYKGIDEEEIERAKVGLKSSLILHSESSSSRAGAIASDYYMLGKVRSLDEIKSSIELTSVDSVVDYLLKQKFCDFTVCTIGPSSINV
jgi:predicted Zn-dependent peptidase